MGCVPPKKNLIVQGFSPEAVVENYNKEKLQQSRSFKQEKSVQDSKFVENYDINPSGILWEKSKLVKGNTTNTHVLKPKTNNTIEIINSNKKNQEFLIEINKVEGAEKAFNKSLQASKSENAHLKSILTMKVENGNFISEDSNNSENSLNNNSHTKNIMDQEKLAQVTAKKTDEINILKDKLTSKIGLDFLESGNEDEKYESDFTPCSIRNGKMPNNNIQEKCSFTNLNISIIKEEKDKSPTSNAVSPINSVDCTLTKQNKKYNCFTDFTGERTIDYSSLEDTSPTGISNSKILRKYNLNPYYNFGMIKKYFIYQLKKSFLQAKKFTINSSVYEGTQFNQENKNLNYHEIFSNYSQISMSTVGTYKKYDDHTVEINNYVIIKNQKLGQGGFSRVYLCNNLKDNLEYAVKITGKNVRANASKTMYEYVKDEVNILKRLYSKYIVRTYEVMETKHECLIFMELMKNNSLFSKLSILKDFKVWKYFRNLISGIEHCHNIAKIVHRDININNLLISDDDTLKISDFGVSMIIDENDMIPVNSGPTTYIPPEKKFPNEESHYSGKKADLWCCGVALYHMVYKKPVFTKSTKLNSLKDYEVELPEDESFPIDEHLRDLLTKLLEVDPNNRYNLNEIKNNLWITKNGEFPLPDIHEEALEYVYNLTSKEIKGIYEDKSFLNEIGNN